MYNIKINYKHNYVYACTLFLNAKQSVTVFLSCCCLWKCIAYISTNIHTCTHVQVCAYTGGLTLQVILWCMHTCLVDFLQQLKVVSAIKTLVTFTMFCMMNWVYQVHSISKESCQRCWKVMCMKWLPWQWKGKALLMKLHYHWVHMMT